MSASYNELLPTDLDWIRSQLGDTDVEDDEDLALHTDEHIRAVLALSASRAAACAVLAHELIVRFSQEPVKVSLSGIAVDYSARIPAWQDVATRMQALIAEAAAQIADSAAGSQGLDTTGVW